MCHSTLKLLNSKSQIPNYEWPHKDRSSFITTTNGYATQFMAYQPYGETLLEQENGASYLSPYTFSAKEKDTETGYSYFGARYYSAELSVWLGVDPMSGERPWLSPYNYCQWNPIKRIDPNGLLDLEANQNGGDPTPQPNTNGTPPSLPIHPTLPNLNPGSGSQTPTPSLPQRMQSMQTERTVPPGTPLQNAATTTQAVGLVADAAIIGLNNVKSNTISYSTPSGANANVATSTVKNGIKTASNWMFFTGLAVDVVQTMSGEQAPGRLVTNTVVGGGAAIVGGVPGLVVAGGYGVLTLTGALDGPVGPAQSLPPTLLSLPDATAVQPRFVIPKF